MQIIGPLEKRLKMEEFKCFTFISMFFVAVLLISNVASSKILALGPFDFDGGTILFPLSYIFGDILTEVYGYKRSRKVIWTGFLMNIMMAVVFVVVGKLPASQSWEGQSAYEMILGWTPRIVAASVIAYLIGEFANSYVLAKIKVLMKGKFLFVRTITSTIFGEFFDTLIFVLIAFYGVLDNDLLIAVIVSNYIFKVGVEVIFTPVTYIIVKFLKKKEGVDVYDNNTNFNPFTLE